LRPLLRQEFLEERESGIVGNDARS
jgi:hypothetical protein